MSEEEPLEAARTAKRAVVLALALVVVVVAVLVIDLSIKRANLDDLVRARRMLDEFKAVAREAADGAKEARGAGDADGPGVAAGNGLVRDAAPGTVLDQAEVAAQPAPAQRKARAARGAPGDE